MGYNYSITGNDELEIKGFNCEEDLQATIEFKGLIRRVNQLKKKEMEDELSEEEEDELDILEEYVTQIQDEEDDDE